MTKDIIVMGEDWGGLPSSTQHLIKSLKKDRKIIWVNSIGLRKPRINLSDLRRVVSKVFTSFFSLDPAVESDVNDSFRVVKPITIPVPHTRFARWVAKYLLKFQILRVARQLELVDPVLWVSLPTAVDLVGALGEDQVLYYCCDDFSSLNGVDHKIVQEREDELCNLADKIVVSSTFLQEKFSRHVALRDKVRYLPHGVDYTLFSTCVGRSKNLPSQDKLVAGFYGSISEWLDTELIEFLAERLPHWNFVFIGRVETDVANLRKYTNVQFLGEKAHESLPAYSQHWDVSLLPFKLNDQIAACNPLKLREYLAAGRPVVTTDFEAVREYEHVVNIAGTKEQFLEILSSSQYCQSSKEVSRFSVKQQSWQAKASELNAWMVGS